MSALNALMAITVDFRTIVLLTCSYCFHEFMLLILNLKDPKLISTRSKNDGCARKMSIMPINSTLDSLHFEPKPDTK